MTENHFTHDEELLERFVLGQLPEDDRERCTQHLQRCEICRDAVRKEQRIAAGVKHLGREQLRESIRSAVGAGAPAAPPWLRIAGIAATVVVVVGIGFVFRWWEASSVKQERTIADLRTEERPSTEQTTPEGIAQRQSVSPTAAPSTGGDAARPEELTARKEGNEKMLRSEREVAREDKTGGMDRANAPGDRGNLAAAANQPSGADALGKLQTVEASSSQQFWVQGVVLPGAGRRESLQPTLESRVREKGKDLELPAGKKTSIDTRRLAASQPAIRQLPSTTLPPARQQQMHLRYRTVETLIQEENGQTSLTLYLDSLVDDRDLRAAHLDYITPDSLILHLSDQRIGYKMPAGWSQTGRAKTDITK